MSRDTYSWSEDREEEEEDDEEEAALRSGGYFRQDHPIVKRAEIYSRSKRRGKKREREREREHQKRIAIATLGSSGRAESATERTDGCTNGWTNDRPVGRSAERAENE